MGERLVGLNRMRSRKKRRRSKARIAFILIVAIIVTLIMLFNSKSGKVTIEIPEGTSSIDIAEILKENDVIKSKWLFIGYLKLSDYNGKIQYGTFEFDKSDSYDEILSTLTTQGAKRSTVTLTIPEGYSVEKIKARVVEMGICSDSEFEDALKKDYDYEFLKDIPHDENIKYRLQGYLYPSTYEFYTDASAEDIIKTMLDEFEKQTSPLGIKEYHKTITLASLVEREAKLDNEREIIAGVITNRLNIDMILQIDATVVYAISNGLYDVERVLFKDLEISSPYNTYKNNGLPVGPICSPSIKSIKAALYPAEHNFLYYHTDEQKKDGSHIFTETYEEHTSTMN